MIYDDMITLMMKEYDPYFFRSNINFRVASTGIMTMREDNIHRHGHFLRIQGSATGMSINTLGVL